MMFINKMDKQYFPKQQQIALDMLRDFMIFKSITVIKYYDLFFGDAIWNDEPDLAMFRYNKEDKKFVCHEELNHNIKNQVPKGVFWFFNLIDRFWDNIYYFIM